MCVQKHETDVFRGTYGAVQNEHLLSRKCLSVKHQEMPDAR